MIHDTVIETNVIAPVYNSNCAPAKPIFVYGRITRINKTGFNAALKNSLLLTISVFYPQLINL